MNQARFLNDNPARNVSLIVLVSLGAVVAGTLVGQQTFWVTILFGLMIVVAVMVRPVVGLLLAMGPLYFALFPNLTLGSFELSVSTLPLLFAAAGGVLGAHGRLAGGPFSRWQTHLLVLLAVGFGFSTVASPATQRAFGKLPNLILYVLILFAIISLIDSPKYLVLIMKATLILAFLLSIWRIELRPFRHMFGFPSLGINGAVFNFHPGVAFSLVILFTPVRSFSKRWRYFAAITLASLVLHGIQYQTRAAWLAWVIVVALVFMRVQSEKRAVLIAMAVLAFTVMLLRYGDILSENLKDTENVIAAVRTGDQDRATGSGGGDALRIRAQNIAWDLFKTRPLTGWGPGSFSVYSPLIGGVKAPEAAFNSWLQSLAELGLIGTLPAAGAFALPLVVTWRAVRRYPDEVHLLAFGFALASAAIAIHLLFISLFYSFAWFHAGLALAAARLSLKDQRRTTGQAVT